MRRILIKDVGRYKAGEIHDWPRITWNQVAEKKGKNKKMGDISKPIEEVAESTIKTSSEKEA